MMMMVVIIIISSRQVIVETVNEHTNTPQYFVSILDREI